MVSEHITDSIRRQSHIDHAPMKKLPLKYSVWGYSTDEFLSIIEHYNQFYNWFSENIYKDEESISTIHKIGLAPWLTRQSNIPEYHTHIPWTLSLYITSEEMLLIQLKFKVRIIEVQ